MYRAATLLVALTITSLHAQDAFITPGDNLVLQGVPKIPVELARRVGKYTEFKSAVIADWHPTKREMLIATRAGDTVQIHALTAPGAKPKQLTKFPDSVSDASYPYNHAESFVFSKGAGGNERYQLYRFDIASGKETLLTDGKSRNSGVRWSRKEDRFIYGSTRRNGTDVDLYLIDANNARTNRLLAKMSGGGWQALDWSPDERYVLVGEYVSINESYRWLLDLDNSDIVPLTPRTEKEKDKVALGGGRFSKDGKGFYMTSDEGSEFKRLVYFDLDSKKTKVLTHHKWDVESFALSPDGKTIAYVVNEDGLGVLHLLNTSGEEEQRGGPKMLGSVSGLHWHKNSKDLGFNFVSAPAPMDVCSLDIKTGEISHWTTSSTGGLDTKEFAEPELIRWNSFDKRSISGYLYHPPAKFKGKRPVIIDIHGGPESQFRPGFLARKNFYLNEMGVALLFPNIRGSAGYGKTFLQLDNGFLREDAYKDIGALFDYIAKRDDLDSTRIMVTGGSYGGHMTLAVATYYPDKIRCAVDVVGISNLVTLLENTEAYRRDLRRAEYGDERDPKMREFLNRIAPVNNAEKITKPLFVIQGKNDPRVPLSEAVQMVKAVRKVGTPVWYLQANDEGHGFAKKKNADFQFYATVKFMEEHLLK